MQTALQKLYKQTKKNYKETNDYIHLTFDERKRFVHELAQTIASWDYARLFAECIDKVKYAPNRSNNSIAEQAFEQVITRFQICLQNSSRKMNKMHFSIVFLKK